MKNVDRSIPILLSSAMKGGTACSLRSRCTPFYPHVMSRQSPDISSVTSVPPWWIFFSQYKSV